MTDPLADILNRAVNSSTALQSPVGNVQQSPLASLPPLPQNIRGDNGGGGGGIGSFFSNIGGGLKDSYSAFSDKVRNDPDFAQALLRFGAQLIQPIQPGQTAFGNLGQALALSLDTLQNRRTARADAERVERQEARTDRQEDRADRQEDRLGNISRRQEDRLGNISRRQEDRADRQEIRANRQDNRQELRANRNLQILEGRENEKVRQFDAQEALRQSEIDLRESQIRLNDRLQNSADGSGKGKGTEAKENTLAKALLAADKTLPVEAQRYTGNPDLAIIDSFEYLNPNNDLSPEALRGRVLEAVTPVLDVMSDEGLQKLNDQIAKASSQLKRSSLTSRFEGTPQATSQTIPQNNSKSLLLQQAAQAIQQGKNRDAVIARAKELGLTDEEIIAAGL